MLLFLWHTTNGGCVCFRYKLCHLNMKYCLGTITCIDLSNIKTNTQHTPHTLFILSICFDASKRIMQKKRTDLHSKLTKAFSICVRFFSPLSFFRFFLRFFRLIWSLLFFVLHFTTFPCFTTLFILHAVFYPVCMHRHLWCMVFGM